MRKGFDDVVCRALYMGRIVIFMGCRACRLRAEALHPREQQVARRGTLKNLILAGNLNIGGVRGRFSVSG